MFNTGKCPKCEKQITHLDIEDITVGNLLVGPKYPGFSAVCPSCRTVISAGLDPLYQKNRIIEEMLEALGVKDKRIKR